MVPPSSESVTSSSEPESAGGTTLQTPASSRVATEKVYVKTRVCVVRNGQCGMCITGYSKLSVVFMHFGGRNGRSLAIGIGERVPH